MAHMIDFSNNRANVAYVGDKPWHGLGQEMDQESTLDQWRVAAGLDWEAVKTPVQFNTPNGLVEDSDNFVVYRNDTFSSLGTCKSRYKLVQPSEVVSFFDRLCKENEFKMETMGSLDEGRKVWALAKVSNGFRIMGQDEVKPYLMLATSFDGSLSTTAMLTSVRTVCNNTLQLGLSKDGKTAVKVSHAANFDETQVYMDLGLIEKSVSQFEEQCNKLANQSLGRIETLNFIFDLLKEKEEKLEDCSTKKLNIIKNIVELSQGKGLGADLKAAKGTLWGVVNSVTQYVDHEQGNNTNNRFRSAQFGLGASLKSKTFEVALKLAA